MTREYRFRLFRLGFLTGLFNCEELEESIREGASGGFRMVRREFTLEPRRILFFLTAPAFGLVFQRQKGAEEPDYDWKIGTYQTRFFTKTIDTAAAESVLNAAALDGFELFFAMKYPCRLLFLFPREAYFFVFRRKRGASSQYAYSVHQTPYRFFTKTIDSERYEDELNQQGGERQLKLTFRDERRLLGLFRQPTAVSIWEST
jgi:hypothetical protein